MRCCGLPKRGFERRVPCVCDDYVVEGGVFLAEAGEAYPENHCLVCMAAVALLLVGS